MDSLETLYVSPDKSYGWSLKEEGTIELPPMVRIDASINSSFLLVEDFVDRNGNFWTVLVDAEHGTFLAPRSWVSTALPGGPELAETPKNKAF